MQNFCRPVWHESLITFNDLPGSKVDSDILFNDANFSLSRQCERKENSSPKSPRVSSRYFQFRFIGIGSFYGLTKSGGKSFKLILRFSPPVLSPIIMMLVCSDERQSIIRWQYLRICVNFPIAIKASQTITKFQSHLTMFFRTLAANTCQWRKHFDTPRTNTALFIEITSMKGILSSVEGWKSNLKGIPGGDDGKVKTNDSNFIATGKSGIDICCRDSVRWLPSASIAIKLAVYGNRRRTSRRRII